MVSRRKFFQAMTKALVGFWAIFLTYPVIRYLKKPADGEEQASDITVCPVNDITPGQSKTFQFGNRPGLLISDSSGNLHAFDATCSHLGCTTQYQPDKNSIYCACHGGVYDINGKNISGPPPRPLTALKVSVKEGKVIVSQV